MYFERRKGLLIRTIQYVSQEFRLPSALKLENGRQMVKVGNCSSNDDCFGSFDVETLIDKYSMITNDEIFVQRMYEMFGRMIRDSIEDKKDPDYMKKILTTLTKHEKYYVEKLPRSQYWHDTVEGNPGFLTTNVDGVDCVWSIGCETNSNYLSRFVDSIVPDRAQVLDHLSKRWVKDLEFHPHEVRAFITNAIVGMRSNNNRVVITQERLGKTFMVPVIHGPRAFELMTYGPSCKAVLEFLDIGLEELIVFGLTQDLCFIEPTIKKEGLKTTAWDRELLGNLVIDPNNYKRFNIWNEHQGTVLDLKKVEPLKLQLKRFNNTYVIPTPMPNTIYGNDGSVSLY